MKQNDKFATRKKDEEHKYYWIFLMKPSIIFITKKAGLQVLILKSLALNKNILVN